MGLRKYFGKKSLMVLPACCLIMISCGKKPVSSENSDEIEVTPGLNKSLSLEMAFSGNAELSSKSYMFEDDAQVTIPDRIYIKTGKPLNYVVNISFNTNHSPDQRDTVSEFYCSYKSVKLIGDQANTTPDGYYHEFVGCFEDIDGDGVDDDLGYKVGRPVFQDRWKYIRLDLISGFSYEETEIFTEFSIDWF